MVYSTGVGFSLSFDTLVFRIPIWFPESRRHTGLGYPGGVDYPSGRVTQSMLMSKGIQITPVGEVGLLGCTSPAGRISLIGWCAIPGRHGSRRVSDISSLGWVILLRWIILAGIYPSLSGYSIGGANNPI